MSQVNINPSGPDDGPPARDDSPATAATNNLTWAVAMVLVIAAIAIAVVYVVHGVMHAF